MCAHTHGLLRRLRLDRPLSLDRRSARYPRHRILARTPGKHARGSQRARQGAQSLAEAALRNVSERHGGSGGRREAKDGTAGHRRRAEAHRRLHHSRTLFRAHLGSRTLCGRACRGQSAAVLYRRRRTGRFCAVRGGAEVERCWVPSRVGKRTRRRVFIGREERSSDVIPDELTSYLIDRVTFLHTRHTSTVCRHLSWASLR